jgi:hypothetical protein
MKTWNVSKSCSPMGLMKVLRIRFVWVIPLGCDLFSEAILPLITQMKRSGRF